MSRWAFPITCQHCGGELAYIDGRVAGPCRSVARASCACGAEVVVSVELATVVWPPAPADERARAYRERKRQQVMAT